MKTHSIKYSAITLAISTLFTNKLSAQIIEDRTAPIDQRPTVIKDSRGLPLINIQAPNSNGLSHNRYTQFDIDAKGATLNNHRNSNPHLAKGTAKVILNEVRSNQASKINGTLTVNGNKADVIIANPNGITVNGGGIKNANHFVLTTGEIQKKQNKVHSIEVKKGKIAVEEKGLKAKESQYTEIIAREIELKGKVEAQNLVLSSGAQSADYTNAKIKSQKSTSATSTPKVGIDSALLGGMYAGSIQIIANENGAGVNNKGTIRAKKVVITSAGKIENSGEISGSEKLLLKTTSGGAAGDINLKKGILKGNGDILVTAKRNLNIDQTRIVQTNSLRNDKNTLTLIGSGVSLNTVNIETPNDIYVASTQNSVRILSTKENFKNKTHYAVGSKKKEVDSAKNKDTLNRELNVINRKGNGHIYHSSNIKGKSINITSAQGIEIEGGNFTAQKEINLYAAGNLAKKDGVIPSAISIRGTTNFFEAKPNSKRYFTAITTKPVEISAENINIFATAQNKDSRLLIESANLKAAQKIGLYAYGEIKLLSGKEEFYSHEVKEKKETKWYGKTKRTITTTEFLHAKPIPVLLSGKQGIDLHTGYSLSSYATHFYAPKGKINITVGEKMALYAVNKVLNYKKESKTKSKLFGITYNKDHKTTLKQLQKPLPAKLIAQSANLTSGWDTILQGTIFKTLNGAKISTGIGAKARAGAKLILEGVKTIVHQESHRQLNALVWQKMQGGGSVRESLDLPKFEGGKLIFDAKGGIIVEIPKGSLKNEISKLAKKPEYAYLNQLATSANVDWKSVSLAYDKWNYKQQGLTAAGAALVAIAVAAVTGGAGAALVGAESAIAASMANAAFTTLSTQASISMINHKGDVGKVLNELGHKSQVKQLVTSVATAGVAQQLLQTAHLANVSADSLLKDRLAQNLINATSNAVIHTAINGGKFDKALEQAILTALVDTTHGELAQHIKGIKGTAEAKTWYRNVAHKIAHAVVGCGAAAATKGKCKDGAMGAAVGEIVAEALLDGRNPVDLSYQDRQTILNRTKLVVGSIAAVTGGDVNVASKSAQTAVENNNLLKGAKIAYKIAEKLYEKKGRLNAKDVGKILKDEGLDIADNVLTLIDAEYNLDDVLALIDIAFGTDWNKANQGKAAKLLEDAAKARAIKKVDGYYLRELDIGGKGDWQKQLNKPEANTIYKLSNGHQYKTDSQGRVVEVKGLLQLDPNDRNTYQQGIAGGECRKTSDCGGHIIASMFKGAGEAINLVPMDRTLNGSGGKWYELERSWKEALNRNETVSINIRPVYEGTSKRPSSFIINEQRNGKTLIPKEIKNTPTGE